MTDNTGPELLILVADQDMEVTLRTLLDRRTPSLGIRRPDYRIYRHPQRDAGVRAAAHDFLRPYAQEHRYALVMFDHEGSGEESRPPEDVAADVARRLVESGWDRDRVAVILPVPELEAWVWASSSHVARVIGMGQDELASFLETWKRDLRGKPLRPKEALQAALRQSGRPFSAAVFKDLAARVSLAHCQDPAFRRLKEVLQTWFPPDAR